MGSLGAWLTRPGETILYQGKLVNVKQQLTWRWKVNLLVGVIAFLSAVITYYSLQPTSLLLDRQAGICTIKNEHLPFLSDEESYHLQDVAYSTLETDGGAVSFVIVLQGGHRISLGGFTDQGNQSEAVAAVNQFLNVSQPGEPAHE